MKNRLNRRVTQFESLIYWSLGHNDLRTEAGDREAWWIKTPGMTMAESMAASLDTRFV